MGIFRTGAFDHDKIVFLGNSLMNLMDSIKLIIFSHGVGLEIIRKEKVSLMRLISYRLS